MELTSDQLRAAEQGETVKIVVDGKAFFLLSQQTFEDQFDYSPWSSDEIDLLADEALEIVTGDGLDELDEP